MANTPTQDEIKRFFDAHPSLRNKSVPTTSQEAFDTWRRENAPDLQDSDIAYFQPIDAASPSPQTTNAMEPQEESQRRRQRSHAAHGDHEETEQNLTLRNAQSLHEDSRYQNIVRNHLQELRTQNPALKIDDKIFVKDETGATIINENVLRQIKEADPSFDLQAKANETFSTAYGDETIEQYEKKGRLRTYKNPADDPAYARLKQSIREDPGNADEHYRKFFTENPARSSYGEQDMALRRAHRQYMREQQRLASEKEEQTREQAKIRRTVYRDQAGRPSLDHDPGYKNTRSRIETRIHEETNRLTAAGESVDQDALRRRITQDEHERFIKGQTREKIDRYTKYHPELAQAQEAMRQREEQEKPLRGTQDDPRIKKLHETIESKTDAEFNRQLQAHQDRMAHPTPEDWRNRPQFDKNAVREQIHTAVTQQEYEHLVRENPALAREIAKTDPHMQKAIDNVQEARNKATQKEPGRLKKWLKQSRAGKAYAKSQERYNKTKEGLKKWAKESRGGRAISWVNNKLRNNIFTRTAKRLSDYRERKKEQLKKWLRNRLLTKAYRGLQEKTDQTYHALKNQLANWFKSTRLGRFAQKITAPFRKLKNKFTNNRFTRMFRSGRDAIDDTRQLIKNYFKNLAKKALRKTFGRAFGGLSRLGGRALRGLGRSAGRTGEKATSQLGRGLVRVGGRLGRGLTRAAVKIVAQTTVRLAALGSVAFIKVIAIVLIILAALFLLILIVYMIICIITGCKSDTPELTIQKSGPAHVPNPDSASSSASHIAYEINVSYGGLADKIVITDKLDANVEFVNADGPIQGKYDPATHTVTWEILGTGTGGPGTPTGDIAKLLPNPLPPDPGGIEGTKNPIVQHFKDNPDLIKHYKDASAKEGIPWQVYAGLHWREGDALPGYSLTSGRPIGDYEPDPDRGGDCDGTPGAVDGRPDTSCKFADAVDDIMYASRHLEGKISKKPSTHEEIVEAMARYNGYPGRSNCHHGTPYPHCPPLFPGEDNSYVFTFFDEKHAVMYEIYCGDGSLCGNNLKASRPGALTVTKWVAENIQ